ncbi:MAG: hypothetical protein AB7N71_10470 [Phycisphaerae bacterium]
MKSSARFALWVIFFAFAGPVSLRAADEKVITVVADFEDDSIATSIGAVTNILQADCKVQREPIPARGQFSLGLEIGATQNETSATVELVLREPIRFDSIDRVGAFVWIKAHTVDIAYRFEDAEGRMYESPPVPVEKRDRWVPARWNFDAATLARLSEDAAPKFPLQLTALRVATHSRGRQYVYIDDLQVEHRVRQEDMLLARFTFDEATRIYEPGKFVATKVTFENRSQEKSLTTSVELMWLRPDGSELKRIQSQINLPHSTADFRSYQSIDFSERIRDPGLYRLVATARVSGWRSPPHFETTIAVAASNRFAARGRARFFGVRSNLLREPAADQLLEIALARDLGAHFVMLDAPWRMLEPKDNEWNVQPLEPLIDALSKNAIETTLSITEPPVWLSADQSAREKEFAALCGEVTRRFSGKVTAIQFTREIFPDLDAAGFETVCAKLGELINLPGKPTLALLLPTEQASAEPPAANCGRTVIEYKGHPNSALHSVSLSDRTSDDGAHLKNTLVEVLLPPMNSAGQPADAVSVLRLFLRAAAAGVPAVQLFDLRDDDVGNYRPEELRGITQRDFSPKMWLIGYLSAAGMIADMTYAGTVFGAPPEYDSALFVGGDRQTAILIPKRNRILPAALMPIRNVEGTWTFLRVDREAIQPIQSGESVVLASRDEPIFATLKMNAAQPRPQIGFAEHPWIQVPSTVFTGQPFEVTVTPSKALRSGYLQLVPAPGAPIKPTKSAVTLGPAGGQTPLTTQLEVVAKSNLPFELAAMTLRVNVNGDQLDIPLQVRPGIRLPAVPASEQLADSVAALGRLTSISGGRPTAEVNVDGAFTPTEMLLRIRVEDSTFVPLKTSTQDAGQTDHLLFGLAPGNQDHRFGFEVVESDDGTVRVRSTTGESENPPSVSKKVEGKIATYDIRIAAAQVGVESFASLSRIRLRVEYRDFDEERFAPETHAWGDTINGQPPTGGYRWIALEEGKK